jgi:hypothetical protein
MPLIVHQQVHTGSRTDRIGVRGDSRPPPDAPASSPTPGIPAGVPARDRCPVNAGTPSQETRTMNLSAPTTAVFLVSIVLAILGVGMHYFGLSLALGIGLTSFHWVLLGFILLALGNLLRGL